MNFSKSLFFWLTVLTLVLLPSAQAADLTLKIDGNVVVPAVAPVIENGSTLVPLRIASETLGAGVSYNDATRQVTIETAAYTVVFTIDSTAYTVNGTAKTMTAPARILSGSTMIPMRAFAEAIGATVNYDAASTTVTVDYFTAMSGSLKITGSTTLLPIAQAAADKLQTLNAGLSISVAGGGSGAGVNDTIAGTNNLGMSSRELTADERAQILDIAVANDGIAIIVHPANKVSQLTSEQAAKIFLGEIKNWSEVGGDNAPILVQTREVGSGTRATLEEMLLSKQSVAETATPHTSSELMKQAVAAAPNAIGFDSIGFVDSKVKAVAIDGVAATAETVKDGSYLMGRSLFILSKTKPNGLAAIYVDYLKTQDCQKNIVAKEGYIGLD